MNKIDKMVEWLEKEQDKLYSCIRETAIDKARSLAAEEAANEAKPDIVKSAIKRCALCGEEDVVVTVCAKCLDKNANPKADKGLVDTIYDLAQSRNKDGEDPIWPSELLGILSRYTDDKPKEESLAELADRKGWHLRWMSKNSRKDWQIDIGIGHEPDGSPTDYQCFAATTYPEAEAKARLWLEKQGEK